MSGDGACGPRATPVSFRSADAGTDEVAITYAGHSTYYIDTPGGVRIATDFNGAYTTGRLPDVVTMNHAHCTHYTLFPDPRIPMCCTAGATTAGLRKSTSTSATSISAT